MRLRSSQFVFLLLLLCSVQWTDALAHPLAEVVLGSTRNVANRPDASSRGGEQSPAHSLRPALGSRTDARPSTAAETWLRAPHSMRQPALQAASVNSYTGLRRNQAA